MQKEMQKQTFTLKKRLIRHYFGCNMFCERTNSFDTDLALF